MDITRLVLGDTLNFTASTPAYLPADGWVLRYRLIPRVGGSSIDLPDSIADTADPTLHRIQVPYSTTGAWAAGDYSWRSQACNDTTNERYTVEVGGITLVGDPSASSGPLELRTNAQKALDDAKAALRLWTPTTKRYRIGDREMEFNSPADILHVISFWQIEVSREENAATMAGGYASRRRIFLRCANG